MGNTVRIVHGDATTFMIVFPWSKGGGEMIRAIGSEWSEVESVLVSKVTRSAPNKIL
jgi:hypothetical protein